MATSEAQSKSLIFQAQYLVADQLNKCSDLSATPFWPEDLLDIEFQIHEALSKQGIACTVMTPTLAYQGRCDKSTAWDFSNLQLVIVENPQINRARTDAMTALDVGYVAQEWLAGPLSETKGMFAPVSIKQGEDGGLVVVTVELKALLHDTQEHVVWPKQQQVVFADGTTIRVVDGVFNDYFSMQSLCSNIGQSSSDIVEADIFAQRLTYSLSSPFQFYTGMKKIYLAESVEEIYPNEFANMASLEKVFFKGKTMAQVQAMDNYPWGISDTSIIQAEL